VIFNIVVVSAILYSQYYLGLSIKIMGLSKPEWPTIWKTAARPTNGLGKCRGAHHTDRRHSAE